MPPKKINPKGKVSKPVKYTPAKPGSIATSKNEKVGGSDLAKDNSKEVVLYEESNKRLYTKIFGNIDPKKLIFYFYEQPDRTPGENGYVPMIPEPLTEENGYPVILISKKLNDGIKHTMLGINFHGKQLKVKFQGRNPVDELLPYFYVQDPVEKNGSYVQQNWYGEFAQKGNANEFGKKKKKSDVKRKSKTFNISLKQLKKDIRFLKL